MAVELVRSHLRVIILLTLGAAVGWGCGGKADDALGLIPADAATVTVVDVELIRSEATDEVLYGFEKGWEERSLGGIGFSFEDLKTLVEVLGVEYGYALILEGRFDFEHIREELYDRGFERSTYQDYVMWEREQGVSVSLVGDRDQAVVGNVLSVKSVLGTLGSGVGILDDDDNDVARVLDRAGKGWVISASNDDLMHGCTGILDLRGCRAMGTVTSKSDEGYLQEFLYRFRTDREAEVGLDSLGEVYRDAPGGMPEMEVERAEDGGAFIVVPAGIDALCGELSDDACASLILSSWAMKFESLYGSGIDDRRHE